MIIQLGLEGQPGLEQRTHATESVVCLCASKLLDRLLWALCGRLFSFVNMRTVTHVMIRIPSEEQRPAKFFGNVLILHPNDLFVR